MKDLRTLIGLSIAGFSLYMVRNWDNIFFTHILPLKIKPPYDIDEQKFEAVDYSKKENWLYFGNGNAQIPYGLESLTEGIYTFYIHPTVPTTHIYWNLTLHEIQHSTVLNHVIGPSQGSLFKVFGPVYAPYYRQASMYTMFEKSGNDGYKALEKAYQDVKGAFTYFLEEVVGDHPFLIIGHSQGANHAMRLLDEYYDHETIQKQLLATYFPGSRVPKGYFPDKGDNELNAVFSWNTFLKSGKPNVVMEQIPFYIKDHYTREKVEEMCYLPKPDRGHSYSSYVNDRGMIQGPERWTIKGGCWFIEEPKERYLKEIILGDGWLHLYDFNFIWGALEKDVLNRYNIFKKNLHS